MSRPLPPDLDRAIRRNVVLLAGAMACLSGMFQLVAALASRTFVQVSGIEGLLGLGPAIFLVTGALSAYQAGRAMDRFGRVPVLAFGFAVGIVGAAVTSLGAHEVSTPLVVAGFLLLGAAQGAVTLVRTAGGDMFPPERRARGIALVLSGAVVGALLGPLVFGPLFAGRDDTPQALAVPWLASGGFALVGLVVVLAVRPDPRRIAEIVAPHAVGQADGAARKADLRVVLRRPGVVPSLVGAFASFGVMVSVMNLTGSVVVDHHDHPQSDVFPIIGAHVFGMYGLVLLVGPLIDRIGRRIPLVGGLLVMAASCALISAFSGVWVTGVLLYGLGLGWNLSFVAASAELADRTTPGERGRLLGFSDQLSGLFGASLALLGGAALSSIGVGALAFGAAVMAAAPALWLAFSRTLRHAGRPGGGVPRPAEAIVDRS